MRVSHHAPILLVCLCGLLLTPPHAQGRPSPPPGARLAGIAAGAKTKLTRLLPRRLRTRLAVRREVSQLLREHPHLTSLTCPRPQERGPLRRLRLRCGLAERLLHKAHQLERAAFVAAKAIPEPTVQLGALAVEGAAFVGVQRLETRMMEATLLEAERHYPLAQTPLSGRALSWLHGRLSKKQRRLTLQGRGADSLRYENWQLLKQVERELAAQGTGAGY